MREETVDNAVFLFFAGLETTTSMLTAGCAALLDHPDQLARLRVDPSPAPRAVEGFLRRDAPIQSRLHPLLEQAGEPVREVSSAFRTSARVPVAVRAA